MFAFSSFQYCHCNSISVSMCQGHCEISLVSGSHAGASLSPVPGIACCQVWPLGAQAPGCSGTCGNCPCLFQVRSPGSICSRRRGPRPLWVSTVGRRQQRNLLSWLFGSSSSSNFRAFRQASFEVKEAVVAEWLRNHYHLSCSAMPRDRRALSVGEGPSKPTGGPVCPGGGQQPFLGGRMLGFFRCRLKSAPWTTDLRAVRGCSEVTSLDKGISDPHWTLCRSCHASSKVIIASAIHGL